MLWGVKEGRTPQANTQDRAVLKTGLPEYLSQQAKMKATEERNKDICH